jgi:hypothetical protein
MEESPEQTGSRSNLNLPSQSANPRYDEIALRAYFIALQRHERGEPGDPLKDWVEAERQLLMKP